METPTLPIQHMPSPSLGSTKLAACGMRKSPSSWKLSHLNSNLKNDANDDDDDALSATDTEDEDVDAAVQRKRARSVWMQKPPRHKNMPSCVLSALGIWKRVLRRDDVSVMSDFFHDLDGADEQAWEIIQQMQCIGLTVSVQQFYALRRCCVYSVVMTAL